MAKKSYLVQATVHHVIAIEIQADSEELAHREFVSRVEEIDPRAITVTEMPSRRVLS